MKTREILAGAYREDPRDRDDLRDRDESRETRPLWRRSGRPWLTRRRIGRAGRSLAVVSLLATFWVAVHLYYYNKLVALETSAKTAWAQVETQLQRRYNLQKNLARMVLRYGTHEREVLTDLTELRVSGRRSAPSAGSSAAPSAADAIPGTAGPGPGTSGPQSVPEPAAGDAVAPSGREPAGSPLTVDGSSLEDLSPEQLQRLFSRIMVMAEQYPQLKLSENFQQFSGAIIQVEADIAERTTSYNAAVNSYRVELKQFPGNMFGWLAGFKPAEYYRPAEEDLAFKPVDF